MTRVLVKFVDEEGHAEDLVSGKIYANTLGYYKNLEDDEESGRPDDEEGTTAVLQGEHTSVRLNGHDTTDGLVSVSIRMDWLNYINIYCLYAVPGGSDGEGEPEVLVSDKAKDMGEFAVVITDVSQFLKRVECAANGSGYRFRHDLVQYYDPLTFHHTFQNEEDAIFWKRDRFSYQQEYRLMLDTGRQEDSAITLWVGDLSDITVKVHSSTLSEGTLGGSPRDSGT